MLNSLSEYSEPENFSLEKTTVWSFPQRGKWATHNSSYRGNWPPQVARNLILKYTRENDVVLDPMVGGGTTLIETKLLNRHGIGVDINPDAVKLTQQAVNFESDNLSRQECYVGDARRLERIKDESIDFIATHPPYLDIIKYSNSPLDGDFSAIHCVEKFVVNFTQTIKEFFRVLKPDHYCAILIGDTRRERHYVPVAYRIMEAFLDCGFLLKEDIIKIQHNCASTMSWVSKQSRYDFYLIMHEHLFIFRKPDVERIKTNLQKPVDSIITA